MEPVDKIEYPTYKQFGKEVLTHFAFDSLDLVEATDDFFELLDPSEQSEVDRVVAALSPREQNMVALEYMLRNGLTVNTNMFGIPVEIKPIQPPVSEEPSGPNDNPEDGGGRGGPDAGDPEPRKPFSPSGSASAAVEEPAIQVGPQPLEQTMTLIH